MPMFDKDGRHPITGCRADSLFEDIWLISTEQMEARVQHLVHVDLHKLVEQNNEAFKAEEKAEADRRAKNEPPPLPYQMMDGTAVIPLHGVTTKYPTSFQMLMGGTSTIRMQQAIRHALKNDDVLRIALHIDSPGGNAAGLFDLVDDVAIAAERKPVWAHIDDQGTSAAMAVASRARWISANRNAQVGSIGVMTKIIDTSKMYEAKGVKVIPIISGKFKGIGMDGVKVTEEQVRDIESRAADIAELFYDVVQKGRGISAESIKKLQARTFIADRGKQYGLLDQICSFDVAMREFAQGKINEPVKRGPASVDPNPAAPRSRRMLKPEQLVQAKAFPGAAHITAENADEVLLQSATSMQTELTDLREFKRTHQAVQPKIDPKLAEGHMKLFLGNLDLQVKNEKLTPAQRDTIKLAVNPKDGVFTTDLVTNEGTVMLPADVILKMTEDNKPAGIVGEPKTGVQPAPREEPGATNQASAGTYEQYLKNCDTYHVEAKDRLSRDQFEGTYGKPKGK